VAAIAVVVALTAWFEVVTTVRLNKPDLVT
jgi:hypothetical protein